jgi:hypothetical protein
MAQNMDNLILSLRSQIPNIPKNKDIDKKIEALTNEKDLTRKYEILPILIVLIQE